MAEFRTRRLEDAGPSTFVAADALVLKVREDGRVVPVHVLIATGDDVLTGSDDANAALIPIASGLFAELEKFGRLCCMCVGAPIDLREYATQRRKPALRLCQVQERVAGATSLRRARSAARLRSRALATRVADRGPRGRGWHSAQPCSRIDDRRLGECPPGGRRS